MRIPGIILTLILLFSSDLMAQDPYINGPSVLCAGDCGQYELIDPNGQILNTEWEIKPTFGFSSDSTSRPTICFYEAGIYVLYAIDSMYDVEEFHIEVYDPFVDIFAEGDCPDFDADNPRGVCSTYCVGSIGVFYIEDVGTPNETEWFVSGGNIIYQDPFEVWVEWTTPGEHSVGAISIGGNCTGENFICVNILDNPDAGIQSSPSTSNGKVTLCRNEVLYLQEDSKNAQSFQWITSDGMTFEGSEFSHSFDQEGDYTITLFADNGCNCIDSTIIEIEVLPSLSPILQCIGTICPSTTVTYYAQGDCPEFEWTVSPNGNILEGGNITDDYITIEWTSGPDGWISIRGNNCIGDYCSHPVSYRIPIIDASGPIEGDAFVCPGELTLYSAPAWDGVYYVWSVSNKGIIVDGQGTPSVSVLWESYGIPNTNQYVEVIYDQCYQGCGGSDRFDVSLLTDFEIEGPLSLCTNENGQFTAKTSYPPIVNVNCSWELKDPSGVVVQTEGNAAVFNLSGVALDGEYTLKATPINPGDFCNTEKSTPLVISEPPPQPSAIDGPDTICPDIPYTYSIQVSGAARGEWMIIDGINQTRLDGKVITYTFGNTPPFEVRAWTSDGQCESNSISLHPRQLNIGSVNGPSQTCAGDYTQYEIENLANATFQWSINPPGAGSFVTGENGNIVEIFWLKAGQAQLEVQSCGSAASLLIDVIGPIQPVILGPDSLCQGDSAVYTTQQVFSSYSWKNVAGVEISTQDFAKLPPGYYTLDVIDASGCPGHMDFHIPSTPIPSAVISTPDEKDFCGGDPPRHLFANITDGTLQFQWFHDGMELPGETSNELVTDEFGTYQVRITNSAGCTAFSNILTLFENCDPKQNGCNGNCPARTCPDDVPLDFDVVDQTYCNEKLFKILSTNLVPGSQLWFFEVLETGTYTMITDQSPTHTFSSAGYYNVVLSATMLIGNPPVECSNWVEQIIPIPIAADFDAQAVCVGSPLNFENTSTFLPGEAIADVEWNFGEPSSGTDNISASYDGTHTYSDSGTYEVVLTITSSSGCISTIAKEVIVLPPAEANFGVPSAGCEGLTATFASDNPSPSDRWIIDYPSSSSDTFQFEEIVFTFNEPGNYDITLLTSNSFGCEGVHSESLSIDPPVGPLSLQYVVPTPLCEGESFTISAPPGGVDWIWNIGDTTENILVTSSGKYWVEMLDPNGCPIGSDTADIEFESLPEPLIAGYVIDPETGLQGPPQSDSMTICADEILQLTSLFSDNYWLVWNNGQVSVNLYYNPELNSGLAPGLHHFSTTATDPLSGCVGLSDTLKVRVIDIPQKPIIQSVPSGHLCEGIPAQLTVTNVEAGITYVWNTGASGPNIEVSDAGVYTVIAENDFGCTSISDEIIVHSAPAKRWVPSGCLDRCNPDTICIPDFSSSVQIEWYKDNVAIPGAMGNTFIAREDGIYQALMTDQYGCQTMSDPLTLYLFDGFGDIEVDVFRDVNENGIIDAGDTLITYPSVFLNENGVLMDSSKAAPDKVYYFINESASIYEVYLDSLSLLPSDEILIGFDTVEIIGCDKRIRTQFLVGESCPADSAFYDYTFYYDKDQNGVYNAGDSLLNDFKLNVKSQNITTQEITDPDGKFIGQDIDGYLEIQLDTTNLSNQYLITEHYDTIVSDCSIDFIGSIGLYLFCTPNGSVQEHILCPNDSIYLGGSWVFQPGTYQKKFTNVGGCDSTVEYTIRNSSINTLAVPPYTNLEPESIIPVFLGISPSTLDQLTFTWSPAHAVSCADCPSPILKSDTAILLTVTVTDSAGCLEQFVFEARVEIDNQLYIPNAFSPNGDGVNDGFRIYPKRPLLINEMIILDRWGDKVFETRDQNPDYAVWDGTFKGKLMNPAVFVYVIHVTFADGSQHMYKGDLTLIR